MKVKTLDSDFQESFSSKLVLVYIADQWSLVQLGSWIIRPILMRKSLDYFWSANYCFCSF